MISIRDVSKSFGSRNVLQHINLTISQGERLAILGFNGAGKTTLFRCLLGLTPFQGIITINGSDVIKDGPTARRFVGYVPQKAPRFDGTYRETVDFFCKLRGCTTAEIERRLEVVGVALETYGDQPMATLSGGMLQKVLLTLALGSSANLLLLDEPTANLDSQARRELLSVVNTAPRDTTVVLSSHQLGDIEAIAHRVIIMNDAQVAYDGSLSNLMQHVADRSVFWVWPKPSDRESAIHALQRLGPIHRPNFTNGRVGVILPRKKATNALTTLTKLGITVEDFAFDTPTMDEILAATVRKTSPEGPTP